MVRALSQAATRRVRRELGPSPRGTPTPPPPPAPKTTLSQLSAAFAPAHVLPADRRQRTIARNIRTTAAAVRRLTVEKGISAEAAGRELQQISREVTARGRVLRRARREGLSKGQTLAGLRKAGVRPELLQVQRSQFVTPEGRFEVAALPGLVGKRRRVRPSVSPRPRPTPRATPRR